MDIAAAVPQTGSPPSPEEALSRAVAALRRADAAGALAALADAVRLRPDLYAAHKLRGAILREQGDLLGAREALMAALAGGASDSEAHLYLGDVKRRLGDAAGALAHCDCAVAAAQRPAEALMTRALARNDLADFAGAADDALAALRFGDSPAIRFALGHFLLRAGQPHEALAHLRRAAELAPGDAKVRNAIGDAAAALGDLATARAAYAEAVARDPTLASAHSNLCAALSHAGRALEAIDAGETAVRLAPQDPIARFNLAVAYDLAQRPEAAIASCEAAVAMRPDYGDALYFLCGLKRQVCDWAGLAAMEERARDLTYRAGKPVPPFPELFSLSSRADTWRCNAVYAAQFTPAETLPPLRQRAPSAGKIRVGYLSADYRNHATATLIVELIELHDRTKFEIFGYSIGGRDEAPLTRRLIGAFDTFRDLATLSDLEAARRIRADGIDILIDLKGYTFQARPGILGHRPAALQVNYLGYPATMGATFIDYMIVDSVVAPPEHQPDYAERLIQMPRSYQPNDRRRRLCPTPPPRASQGLPEHGFVFCCLNGSQKLNPMMFDIWMRLLAATPGAVLWLLAPNARAAENLRRAAQARGVAPGRLVFAPKVSFDDHLARMGLADLFLDTLPCGGHTTASEALWAGVPVLTCLGETFAGRVAASLLDALDLNELVAPDLGAYEAMALRLAQTPAELHRLRARLVAARDTAPLFDTPAYAQAFETALTRMIDRHASSQPPEGFAIA